MRITVQDAEGYSFSFINADLEEDKRTNTLIVKTYEYKQARVYCFEEGKWASVECLPDEQ